MGAGGGGGEVFGFAEVIADAAEERADPEDGFGGRVDPEKHRLAAEGGDELAQLGAVELEEKNGGGLRAETLQGGEGGQDCRRRRAVEVDFDFDGDGVPRSGGGEVGRKQETQHEPATMNAGSAGG